MAIKASRQAEAFTYIPKADRELPVEQQSRFVLRPLSLAERLRAIDELRVVEHRDVDGVVSEIVHTRGFQQSGELVRTHLLDAHNFPAGAPERWPADGTRAQQDAYLEQLDEFLILELGNALRERSAMSDAAGNSSAPAPTST